MLYGKTTLAVVKSQGMKSYVRRVLRESFLKSAGPIEEPGEQRKRKKEFNREVATISILRYRTIQKPCGGYLVM